MKRIYLIYFMSLSMVFLSTKCSENGKSRGLRGPYLGQKLPGDIPEIFAPGVISYGFHEHAVTISPDGDEIFYVTADNSYSRYIIIQVIKDNERWLSPEVAPFSKDPYMNFAPSFSPDGEKLYFASTKPADPGADEKKDSDIWVVNKLSDSWSEPVNIGAPVNTEQDEANPSVSSDGTLYFQANYDEKTGWDLFCSKIDNGKNSIPLRLSDGVNTTNNESAPYIAPDESFLLFHSNRPGGYGSMDLYVSYRQKDGSWGIPVNLGEKINSSFSDWKPFVTPDGKHLFFSSYRTDSPENLRGKSYIELMQIFRSPQNGTGTLYWVSANIIEELKPEELK